jgi:hypothetical protein
LFNNFVKRKGTALGCISANKKLLLDEIKQGDHQHILTIFQLLSFCNGLKLWQEGVRSNIIQASKNNNYFLGSGSEVG